MAGRRISHALRAELVELRINIAFLIDSHPVQVRRDSRVPPEPRFQRQTMPLFK